MDVLGLDHFLIVRHLRFLHRQLWRRVRAVLVAVEDRGVAGQSAGRHSLLGVVELEVIDTCHDLVVNFVYHGGVLDVEVQLCFPIAKFIFFCMLSIFESLSEVKISLSRLHLVNR